MRDRSFESQVYRASGLNLLIAAIILWNTRYLEQTFVELRAPGRRCLAYACRARRAAWLGAYRPRRGLCPAGRPRAAQWFPSAAQAARIHACRLNVPPILI